jgi:hypothetical protein
MLLRQYSKGRVSGALLQKKDKPENKACDLIDYVL